jgi:hypothetical protein
VEYGDKQRGTLQDTVFFWLIPWKEMLAVFLSLGVVFLSLTMYWYNNYAIGRRQKLAHAGAYIATEEKEEEPPVFARREVAREWNTAPAAKPEAARHEAVRLAPREKNLDNKPTYVVNLKR